MPDLAVSGELADNAAPHPAVEPQLSFPAQIQENTVEIALPHTGRLKISAAENAAESSSRSRKRVEPARNSQRLSVDLRRN